jgi:general secretion pathway protein G
MFTRSPKDWPSTGRNIRIGSSVMELNLKKTIRIFIADHISSAAFEHGRTNRLKEITRAPRWPTHRAATGTEGGFTLLELMIVITVILILMSIAIPRFQKSEQYAREAALKQDLFVMRQAIQNYTLDKQAAPQSLDDLVSAGYLGSIPTDPMTRAKEWTTETSDLLLSPEQTSTGIVDVHSTSTQSSPFDSTPYSSW